MIINLRPAGYTKPAILESFARTTILKLNEDELDVPSNAGNGRNR
ncbi:MAG: hypothetical protein R2860_10705 [Desulfobacterales bacterium]